MISFEEKEIPGKNRQGRLKKEKKKERKERRQGEREGGRQKSFLFFFLWIRIADTKYLSYVSLYEKMCTII